MDDFKDNILLDREQKSKKIQFLKSRFVTVITVKSNIPGDNKNIYFSYILIDLFKNLIPSEFIQTTEYIDGKDGPYFLIGSNEDAYLIKEHLTRLEDTHSLGRFIDLDVYSEGNSLSRGTLRKCYLCSAEAFVCMRNHNHSVSELLEYMEKSIIDYYKTRTLEIIDESVILELETHPKFGLVTPYTNGSHDDMNFSLMMKSKDAIIPYFEKMFIIGWNSLETKDILKKIRRIGLEAEVNMMNVTNGVNTYKGLIFNLGILVAAYSYCVRNNIDIRNISYIIKEIAKNIFLDFNSPSDTYGYFAYKKYNITGVRGEAKKGMPHIFLALDYLSDFSNQSRVKTLMFLISKIEDTVLLKRSGSINNYRSIKEMFKQNINSNYAEIEELNNYCIKNNLSFGGSADLLIATIFLKKILI